MNNDQETKWLPNDNRNLTLIVVFFSFVFALFLLHLFHFAIVLGFDALKALVLFL